MEEDSRRLRRGKFGQATKNKGLCVRAKLYSFTAFNLSAGPFTDLLNRVEHSLHCYSFHSSRVRVAVKAIF